MEEITSADVFAFLTPRTAGLKQSTKHQKYVFLMSFFNFCISVLAATIPNPCDTTVLRKTFRNSKPGRREILSKEIVDEIIIRTPNSRDRQNTQLQGSTIYGDPGKERFENRRGPEFVRRRHRRAEGCWPPVGSASHPPPLVTGRSLSRSRARASSAWPPASPGSRLRTPA